MKTKPTKNYVDTSNYSKDERAAMEMAENSRDKRKIVSFVASIFQGKINFKHQVEKPGILPWPSPIPEQQTQAQLFLQQLETFMQTQVDADEIDQNGEIPIEVIQGLANLGAFGIKIPKEYGGLGFPQSVYSKAVEIVGSHCGSITALLSAHQSIGLPQPLLHFGTQAQKETYLSACAKGAISAFALTEPEVGSDPAKMTTTAEFNKEKTHYIINGIKLWCTNGTKASNIIVMAKDLTIESQSSSAFILPMDTPGIQITHRCHFMGLKALYNAVIEFDHVKIPIENLVGEAGKGLKIALSTLNTGRLSLPAACLGMMKRCLNISLNWANQREQWGKPIAEHEAISLKIANMQADILGTESMVSYISNLIDNNHDADIRLEAAMAKLWGTEAAWTQVNETMQIRGGRGYETAQSLNARGESPDPVERMLRDCRINTIFEGSSEIMVLFIAREALDHHLRIGGPVLNSQYPIKLRIAAAIKAAAYYACWYPSLYLKRNTALNLPSSYPELKRITRYLEKQSRKLAKAWFHAMLRYGPKLPNHQNTLAPLVWIGSELFALSTAVAYTAHQLTNQTQYSDSTKQKLTLASLNHLYARSQKRISYWQHNVYSKSYQTGVKLSNALIASLNSSSDD